MVPVVEREVVDVLLDEPLLVELTEELPLLEEDELVEDVLLTKGVTVPFDVPVVLLVDVTVLLPLPDEELLLLEVIVLVTDDVPVLLSDAL